MQYDKIIAMLNFAKRKRTLLLGIKGILRNIEMITLIIVFEDLEIGQSLKREIAHIENNALIKIIRMEYEKLTGVSFDLKGAKVIAICDREISNSIKKFCKM